MNEGPAALRPVGVAKPWGQEIWYSGREARGESGVCTAAGVVPLSRYLIERGRARPVILLKILQPTTGNLYLEVHETKSEVYIVDRIDGAGRMLLGPRHEVLARTGEGGFRAALRRVAARAEAGSADLEDVQSFMNPVYLAPGDAVTIPSRVPHSLLRGVHVIEFQTPVFERRILAASQPVVTQRGWDVDAAVQAMDLSVQPSVHAPRGDAEDVIAVTCGFSIVRHRVASGAAFRVAPWSVGWVSRGEVRCRDRRFGARTAFLAPEQADLQAAADAEVLLATETTEATEVTDATEA